MLYENVYISNPKWYPIWIGPQQQHEPHTDLGDECSLAYPLVDHCPTVPCVTFDDIRLVNVSVENPAMGKIAGVVLGNESNPIANLRFENVHVGSSKVIDDGDESSYICSNVGTFVSSDSSPELVC